MIFIGRAIRENGEFNYAEKSIAQAKEKIKEFETLNLVVDNFNGITSESYNKNLLLILAKDSVSNPFMNGKADPRAEDRLKKYEILLKFLIERLDKNSKEKIKSRIKGFGENHFKTISGLDFFMELIKANLVKDVEYENPERGNHDFFVKFKDTELNLELTSIGEGKIQSIIETAFSMASDEIINHIPERTLLKLDVDTDLVLDLEGNNNSDIIKNKIVSNFQKIKPVVNVLKNNYCIIERNFGDSDKSLYDYKDVYQYYNEFGERLLKLSETEEGMDYLKNTKVKELSNIPISSFIIGDATTKLVEIHSHSFWPSNAESLRKESILRQFKNRLNEKIKEKQLQGKDNPVIAFNFHDVIFHDYSSDEDLFGKEHLQELKSIIEEKFIENNEKQILGVLLFEGTLKKSKFISNPNVNIEKEVLSTIESLRV